MLDPYDLQRDDIALDPDAANWAGIAVFKRAYELFQERGYKPRLLANPLIEDFEVIEGE